MPALQNFVNTIGPENFVWNAERQIHELKDKTTIYKHLRTAIAPYGYKWVPTHVGRYANGVAYFAGTLTVKETDGSEHTVAGYAEGYDTNQGINGVGTDALANAVMRGLGCAEYLYESREAVGAQVPSVPVPPPPAPVVTQPQGGYTASEAAFAAASAKVQQEASARSSKFPDPNTSNNGKRKPWDGTIKVKSGPFAGTAYRDMPLEKIKEWAANGTTTAVAELDRRMTESGQIPPNVFQTGGR